MGSLAGDGAAIASAEIFLQMCKCVAILAAEGTLKTRVVGGISRRLAISALRRLFAMYVKSESGWHNLKRLPGFICTVFISSFNTHIQIEEPCSFRENLMQNFVLWRVCNVDSLQDTKAHSVCSVCIFASNARGSSVESAPWR